MRAWFGALAAVLVLGLAAWSSQSFTGAEEGGSVVAEPESISLELPSLIVDSSHFIGQMGGIIAALVILSKGSRKVGEVLTEIRFVREDFRNHVERNDKEHETLHRRVDRVQDEIRGRTER